MNDMTPDELIAALEKLAAGREGLDTEPQILAAYDTLATECDASRLQLMRRAFILVRREVTEWRRKTGGGMRLFENKEGER